MTAFPLLALALGLAFTACDAPASRSTDRAALEVPADTGNPTPETTIGTTLVVAELFTSEGCSSCPPADRLLARLAAESIVDGVPLLALSYHVDYWDRLGWADPFGSPVFSARQRAYAATLDGRVYTPQLVVGGDRGFVGSREREARTTIAETGREQATATVALSVTAEDRTIRAAYVVEADLPPEARIHLLLVQKRGASDVRRGENRGRQLAHVHVVRAIDTREVGTGTALMTLPDGLDAADVFVAALVQPDRVGRILGAGRAEVSAES